MKTRAEWSKRQELTFRIPAKFAVPGIAVILRQIAEENGRGRRKAWSRSWQKMCSVEGKKKPFFLFCFLTRTGLMFLPMNVKRCALHGRKRNFS
jgi:hypothetical protein